MTFVEYSEYIYLNTTLPRRDANLIAVECWNRGMSKEEALEDARELYM